MSNFYVVFFNDSDTSNQSVVGKSDTVVGAGKIRQTSGDIVFDSEGKIVQNKLWLFKWERLDPMSYAKRQIKINRRIKLRL